MSQQINLYNPAFRRQKKYFSSTNMLQALLALIVGTALVYGYAWYLSAQQSRLADESSVRLSAAQKRLAEATVQFGPRLPSKVLQEEVARMDEQARSRSQILDLMGRGELGNRQGFSGYLLALSRQTLAGLWITGFRVVGRGTDMAISGRALRPELVPSFIDLLKREPVMAGQTFSTLDMKLPPPDIAVAGKPAALPPFIEFNLRKSAEESVK